jgi:hypothetical protein
VLVEDVDVLRQLPARPRPVRRLRDVKRGADQEGALLSDRDVGQALRGDQEDLLRGIGGDVGRQAAAAQHPPDHASMRLEHLFEAAVIAGEWRSAVHRGSRYRSVSEHRLVRPSGDAGLRAD